VRKKKIKKIQREIDKNKAREETIGQKERNEKEGK
jgi:hypothetical protein